MAFKLFNIGSSKTSKHSKGYLRKVSLFPIKSTPITKFCFMAHLLKQGLEESKNRVLIPGFLITNACMEEELILLKTL